MSQSQSRQGEGRRDRERREQQEREAATRRRNREHEVTPDDTSPYPLGIYTRDQGTTQLHSFKVYNTLFHINSKYYPVKGIGRGAYGVVVSACDVDIGRKVAIKKVPQLFHDLVDAKRILREIKLLQHLKHENIVSLVDIIPNREALSLKIPRKLNDLYIILDYMDSDLHKIIYSNNTLSDEHIQYLIYQILRGLKYIHSANVIHRDLKPSNLLLNANCHLRIADFGLARAYNERETMTEYVVTRWYRAPEIMCSNLMYDYQIDVWSTGCIFAELLMRNPIFPGDDYRQQLHLMFSILGTPTEADHRCITNPFASQFIKSLPPRSPTPLREYINSTTARVNINPLALDLLEKMLVFDPAKRITIDKALKHPYLAALHDPTIEVVCETPWNSDFELSIEGRNLTRDKLAELFFEEMQAIQKEEWKPYLGPAIPVATTRETPASESAQPPGV